MGRQGLLLSTLLLCYLAFFDFDITSVGVSYTVNGWIVNAMFVVIVLINIKHFKGFFSKEYVWINILTLLLCLIMIYSAQYNEGKLDQFYRLDHDTTTSSKLIFWRAIKILFAVFFVELVNKYNKQRSFLYIMRNYMICYALFSTISLLSGSDKLLFGGKFAITYIDIYLCALQWRLTLLKTHKDKLLFFVFVAHALYMSVLTECSTSVMAILALIVLASLRNAQIKKLLYKPIFMISFLVFCSLILFLFSTWILSFPVVQDFIVNVLHEDLTLTGRLFIYESIIEVFEESPLVGFGPSNYQLIAFFLTGCENAQNGIVNLYLEIGLLGVSCFIVWFYLIFRKAVVSEESFPIIAFIYSWILISSVEIPFSYMSFYIMASLLMLKTNTNAKASLE